MGRRFRVLDSASAKLAEYLIRRGATVDIHAAARLGMIDRIRELLTLDPLLVHARGGDGQLPLHFAATVEIAALLLDHGADIDARDIDHESTAAQYMVCSRQYMEWREPYRHDVVSFLISYGAKPDILMASALGDLALVERILNHHPETIRTTVTEPDFPKQNPKSGGSIYNYGFGFTKSPHMIAIQFGHRAVFELLMQRSPRWLRLINAAEVGEEPPSTASLPIIRSSSRGFPTMQPGASSAQRYVTTREPSSCYSKEAGRPRRPLKTTRPRCTTPRGTATLRWSAPS